MSRAERVEFITLIVAVLVILIGVPLIP